MSYLDKIRNQKNIVNPADEDERINSYDDISFDAVVEAETQAKSIVKTGIGALDFSGFHADAAGLEILEDTPFEYIKQSADMLFKMQSRIQIWIGDLLNSVDDLKYGEITRLAEQYNLEPTTLHKWKSIASNVKLFLRRNILLANPNKKPLTKTHYELVMALDEDEQERLLMLASANEWSVAKLRSELPRKKKSKSLPTFDYADTLVKYKSAIPKMNDSDKLKLRTLAEEILSILGE